MLNFLLFSCVLAFVFGQVQSFGSSWKRPNTNLRLQMSTKERMPTSTNSGSTVPAPIVPCCAENDCFTEPTATNAGLEIRCALHQNGIEADWKVPMDEKMEMKQNEAFIPIKSSKDFGLAEDEVAQAEETEKASTLDIVMEEKEKNLSLKFDDEEDDDDCEEVCLL